MPVPQRRFLAMLWLSLALHAVVIGLTQLPPPVKVPLPAELRVEIVQPAPLAQPVEAMPQPKPKPEPTPVVKPTRPLLAGPQPLPQSITQPLPAAPLPRAVPAPAPSVPAVEPDRESPGPALNVPLLADTRYYTAKELDVQPTALRRPEPLYPVRAEEQGVAGRVVIRLHLEADGSISRIEVVSVMPGGVFGEMFRKATLDSLGATRFKPAQRNGQPVRAVVEIPVVFEPDN